MKRIKPSRAPQGAAALAELLAGVGSPARSVDLTEEPEDVMGALVRGRSDTAAIDAGDAREEREAWAKGRA